MKKHFQTQKKTNLRLHATPRISLHFAAAAKADELDSIKMLCNTHSRARGDPSHCHLRDGWAARRSTEGKRPTFHEQSQLIRCRKSWKKNVKKSFKFHCSHTSLLGPSPRLSRSRCTHNMSFKLIFTYIFKSDTALVSLTVLLSLCVRSCCRSFFMIIQHSERLYTHGVAYWRMDDVVDFFGEAQLIGFRGGRNILLSFFSSFLDLSSEGSSSDKWSRRNWISQIQYSLVFWINFRVELEPVQSLAGASNLPSRRLEEDSP